MKNNIWMITLWAGILFFSGATAGFFASRMIAPPPPPWGKRPGPPPSPENIKNMIRERTFERFKLSPEQQKLAMPAIDRWMDRMEKLRQTQAPEFMDIFNEFFDQMDRLLTPAQKPELEKMRQEISWQHSGKNKNHPER